MSQKHCSTYHREINLYVHMENINRPRLLAKCMKYLEKFSETFDGVGAAIFSPLISSIEERILNG